MDVFDLGCTPRHDTLDARDLDKNWVQSWSDARVRLLPLVLKRAVVVPHVSFSTRSEGQQLRMIRYIALRSSCLGPMHRRVIGGGGSLQRK